MFLVCSVSSEILVDSVLDTVTLFRSPKLILFKDKNLVACLECVVPWTDKHLQENLSPDKTVTYHSGWTRKSYIIEFV